MSELFSGRGGSADAIVNVAAVEFRFGAVVLTKYWRSIKSTKRLAYLDQYFSTHGYAISLIVVVATE